ncbi:MAG: RimK family alpha-L-glutamate ligase [Candidatus Lokiarchaeota archaeon]|nr:RimK family alpha-L-glutamate ligase [Candidatus Lokiarchaeota archaeon]MBD3202632.1 RimK family alpha-L-glutamate ligase [Candidatus Lokiarchaeota archaeon]
MDKKTIIITPKPEDNEVQLLKKELEGRGFIVEYFIPANYKANIDTFEQNFADIHPKGALVRGFGADVTQKIFFRLDLLSVLEEFGFRLINSRQSLEVASDKFLSSLFLKKYKLPTPRTIVCENSQDALNSFDELGGDVILKPLYGSKGIGITRLNNKDFAENVIYTLEQLNEIFYLQEFVEHYNRDIRILVVGDKVVDGMYRVSDTWKTNIHAGAQMKPIDLNEELKELAIKAAKATKTEIAGVDIIESEQGYQILEVNSIPGFTALQKVSKRNITAEIIEYFIKTIEIWK